MFTGPRDDLAEQVQAGGKAGPDPEKARHDLATYDVLLAGLRGNEAFIGPSPNSLPPQSGIDEPLNDDSFLCPHRYPSRRSVRNFPAKRLADATMLVASLSGEAASMIFSTPSG
jgi:hypothetical protein